MNRYDTKFCQKTIKYPAKVMVWGCFSGHKGRGTLAFLPKGLTMNKWTYLKVLNYYLPLPMQTHRSTHFQQDNAPCHRADLIMDWFKTNKVKVIAWPGNSPDLNPIESVWKIFKDRVMKYSQNTSIKTLKTTINRVWRNEMSLDYFRKLADSMPNRIEACIATKGKYTKY